MSYSCFNDKNGFSFSAREIAETVGRKGLLTMEIEFSLACNFSCPYCYNSKQQASIELESKTIDRVLTQAREMGARKIVILGGEPMIYPEIHEKIRLIRRLGMEVEMFTNGSSMTPENARFMYQQQVSVVLKRNSFNPELQNRLAGREDASDIITNAYLNLTRAGYPAADRRLAVSTIICEQNLEELPDLWRWLRRHDIEPYFEMITPQGGGAGDDWSISSLRQRRLFEELAAIDKREYNRSWEPQPPLVGNACLRHQFSCLVNAHGAVMPCVGVTLPLGNVYEQPLQEILEKSEVMDKLRHFPDHIKGGCRLCDKADHCYGCRGAAYQVTGDYLASDPTCWHNQDENIEMLPAAVEALVPHAPPMVCVDTLLELGERQAHLRYTVKPDNPFVDEQGRLDAACYVEMTAQSLAAWEGFQTLPEKRANLQGMLMSARKFSSHKTAQVGDLLDINVEKVGFYEDFGVASGTITRNGEIIAQGQISIYKPETHSF